MYNPSTLLSDIFDKKVTVPDLELDDERDTIAAAQAGDSAAKEKLILAYARSLRNGVIAFTRNFSPEDRVADVDDVRSQALLGFLEAVRAFNPLRHDRLAAIAPEYIRQAVTSEAASASSFTVPERTLKRFFAILRLAEGNIYDAAALAPTYEMRKETFLAILSAIRNVDSLDLPEAGGEDTVGVSRDGWSGAMVRPLWDNVEPDSDSKLLVAAAFDAVNTLEGDVVRLAYGFADYDPVPDAEIAARLGLSRQKTQRTRNAALDKMRERLAA